MARQPKFTSQLVIQVTPEVKKYIEDRAETEQLSQADIARELLDAGLKALSGPQSYDR